METKRHYRGHLEGIDDGPSTLLDATAAEMRVFLAITIQIGNWIRDKVTDYWATTNQFHTHLYSSAMKRDRHLHILRFLHFTDKNNERHMKDENSDRLWKKRSLFEIPHKTFSKFYSPSENLDVDQVIVLFKGRVFSDNTYSRNTNVLASKFTNHMTRLDTRYDSLLFPWRGWGNFIHRFLNNPREWHTGNDDASRQTRIASTKVGVACELRVVGRETFLV